MICIDIWLTFNKNEVFSRGIFNCHLLDSVYSTDSVPPAPTIHKREYSGRTPGLGDIMMATVDEIPKRGRISNKMKPLLRVLLYFSN